MNYETQVLGDSTIIMDGDDRRRSRKKLIIGAGVVGALIAVAAAISMRGGDPAATPAPGAVAPVVTVTSPGQSTVARTVRATGSLAARVDMPVGVVGEGGMVSRVLVQPGDWVKAGQTLATIERSVQSEQVRSLAAQVEVARADAKLAQAQLDRAKALVGRGFISAADIDQRTATRDQDQRQQPEAGPRPDQCRSHGQSHAHDPVPYGTFCTFLPRQPAKAEDEEDGGDYVSRCCKTKIHLPEPFTIFGTWQACAVSRGSHQRC